MSISPLTNQVLNTITLRDVYYLCKASYKPKDKQVKYLGKHQVNWEVRDCKDVQHLVFGSWRTTIYKNRTLNEWCFSVEGTSSIRNLFCDIVHQIDQNSSVVHDVYQFLKSAERAHNMTLKWGVGHSAGPFISQIIARRSHFGHICVIGINPQRPQQSDRFVNLRAPDDWVTAFLGAPNRCIDVPGASGHALKGFDVVKHKTWSEIIPGYRSPNAPSVPVTIRAKL